MQHLADRNDLSIRKSSINNQILTLLTKIEDEKVEGKPSPTLETPSVTINKSASIPINWKLILPIALVGVGLLVYFVGFRQNSTSNSNQKSACELSFEKAEILFDNEIFDKAKLELTDIKYAKDCNFLYERVDRLLSICNQKLAKNEPDNNEINQQKTIIPTKENTSNKSKKACELSIKKVRRLMNDKEFAKARAELVDVKYVEECEYLSDDISKMLAICDNQLDAKTFKILKTNWQVTPQRYNGKCPISIQFSGNITTNQKSGSLQYFIEFGNRNGTRAVTKTINSDGIVRFSFPYNFEKEEIYADKMKAVLKVINPKTQTFFYTSEPIIFEIKCQ